MFSKENSLDIYIWDVFEIRPNTCCSINGTECNNEKGQNCYRDVSSFAECLQSCTGYGWCTIFSYNKKENECWIQNHCHEILPTANCTHMDQYAIISKNFATILDIDLKIMTKDMVILLSWGKHVFKQLLLNIYNNFQFLK